MNGSHGRRSLHRYLGQVVRIFLHQNRKNGRQSGASEKQKSTVNNYHSSKTIWPIRMSENMRLSQKILQQENHYDSSSTSRRTDECKKTGNEKIKTLF